MNLRDLPRFLITEVHNYGGFFGGDTVTLDAAPLPDGDEPRTLVIDEKALENVAERHRLVPGMLLALQLDGERVDHAWLLGAASHAELREALGPAQVPAGLEAPLVLSWRCPGCTRWIASLPGLGDDCPACGAARAERALLAGGENQQGGGR